MPATDSTPPRCAPTPDELQRRAWRALAPAPSRRRWFAAEGVPMWCSPFLGRIQLSVCQMFADLPAFAAWRFVDAVDGFEVVYAQRGRLRGHTSAVEDGQAYAVRYEIALDDRWRTREACV